MDPHLREARDRLNQELDKLRIVTAAYVESIWDEYVQGKKESKKDVDVLLGKINEIQRDPTLSTRECEFAIANLKNKRQKIDVKAAEERSLTISTTESTYKHCKIISLPGFHSRLLDEVDTLVEAKQWEAFKKHRTIPAAVAVATPSSLTDDSRLVQSSEDGSSAVPAAEELAGGTQVDDDDDDDNSAGKFVCFKIGCHIM
ncbi:hypothetical protein MPSEU_000672500 [Mayamaea pseudoterrestris]|nr:hypothetical protein MPSEU_000672500 [Mayamaea pseudoterrestris]